MDIVSEDIEGWLVASEDNITEALDTHISEDLLKEGIAREFVSRIQNLRKSSGYEITDRIVINFNAPDEISMAIGDKKDYVMNETLAQKVIANTDNSGEKIEIDDQIIYVRLVKI